MISDINSVENGLQACELGDTMQGLISRLKKVIEEKRAALIK